MVDNILISRYGTGTYNLTGGKLRIERDQTKSVYIGDTGAGRLNMGDANGSGVIEVFGTDPDNVHLVVRSSLESSGVINGWGGIHIPGKITMNGLVIADGYGTDRTLWMTNSSGIIQPLDNDVNDTNGWYAVNHGKLALPAVPLFGAPNNGFWGENTDLDLVNSVKIHGVSGSGVIIGTLLASDHDDVNPNVLAVGVWEFSEPAGTFNKTDLTFRYDHVKADELGIAEADLMVYRHNGSKWIAITDSVDTVNRTITTTEQVGVDGQYAVGKYVPAGTAIIVQ